MGTFVHPVWGGCIWGLGVPHQGNRLCQQRQCRDHPDLSPAWLLRVKVLPGKVAAASIQQIWCDHHCPGAPGDKVRAVGREGCLCGSSSDRQESRGQGGQAGGGCDSRAEVTSLEPSGPWGDTKVVGLVSQPAKEPTVRSRFLSQCVGMGSAFTLAVMPGATSGTVTGALRLNASIQLPHEPPWPARC